MTRCLLPCCNRGQGDLTPLCPDHDYLLTQLDAKLATRLRDAYTHHETETRRLIALVDRANGLLNGYTPVTVEGAEQP